MSNRYIPIAVVSAVLAVVALVGYLWPDAERLLPVKALPERVLLDNTAGKVVFDHAKHYEEYGVSCQDCHHDRAKPTPVAQACRSCHGAVEQPGFREAHLAAFTDQMSCVTCHHAEFSGYTGDDDGTIPPDQAHAEGDLATCTTCHIMVDTRVTLREKGWVTINPQYADCSVCHVNQALDDLIPGRMQAFHASCMGCHEKLERGPYGQDTCEQCHTK